MLNFFGNWAGWGPDFLRLGVGIMMIIHGYPKLFGAKMGPKGLAQWLKSIGFSPPLFWAYVLGISEFLGGICILLGLFTRLVALVLAIEFLVIIFRVKWAKGWSAGEGGWEWDFVFLTMLLSLLVTGPGRWALDSRIHAGL